MKPWVEKAERFVHRAIPYSLVILLFVIVAEIFFSEWAHHHELLVKGADYLVVFVFVLDLIFKYNRMRNLPKFLRSSWLDIIAVFPFFLVFRLIEELSSAIRAGEIAQTSLHEVLEVEKAAKVLKQGTKGTRMAKAAIAIRFIRPLLRIPRFAKAITYFWHPKHHDPAYGPAYKKKK
ncbi:hypothetical protein COV93_09010 [Candidatus Woesearchaeota archaeon CG11_big_fil_rev_8_21_14_0_20_43_8]|nr:MAG: hypothetical protein COV93_09010 [Candidatus Woesearchaeota archaeon CG11_big_fil_rev_8_21_14_0_20_43_8]PIO04604.1 MAG: hypothetical protein COT47_08300 [Candidatus Woesearchaeota archaeon CG08_land_8_20_14_0_20_43_7]